MTIQYLEILKQPLNTLKNHLDDLDLIMIKKHHGNTITDQDIAVHLTLVSLHSSVQLLAGILSELAQTQINQTKE